MCFWLLTKNTYHDSSSLLKKRPKAEFFSGPYFSMFFLKRRFAKVSEELDTFHAVHYQTNQRLDLWYMQWTLYGICLRELCIWTLYVIFYMYFEWGIFLSSEDKHASKTTMATKINITKVPSFDIHDESNLARRWKKWKQSFSFIWLPLVGTMIHRCRHCYFTVLGQIYSTFLCICKTLVRHTWLQWMA